MLVHLDDTIKSAFTNVCNIDLMYVFIVLPSSFSAGVGRTGTFITLDAMMERLKERDDLNIFEFVNAMRTRRMYMVQTLVRSDVYLLSNTYVVVELLKASYLLYYSIYHICAI